MDRRKTNEKKVSIIVPVYNVRKYLDFCIKSILSQNQIENAEVLLIDDGSNDGSECICDQYANKYPSIIKVFHNENKGLLYSRQFGISKAVGKYIMNCDSDDFLCDNALKQILDTLEKKEIDVVLYNINSYKNNKIHKLTNSIFPVKNDEGFISVKKVHREFLSSNNIVSMCCKVYKRKIVDQLSFLNYGKIGNSEDTLQSKEIFLNGKTFYYIDKGLYNYRIQTGMTSKFDANYFTAFSKTIEEIIDEKERWDVSNFDLLISEKVFFTLARAITQIRYDKEPSLFNKVPICTAWIKNPLFSLFL